MKDSEMRNKLIRINLTKHNFDKLIELVEKSGDEYLLEEINERKSIIDRFYPKKSEAIEKATSVRVAKAKRSIRLAVDYLKRNDKKLTQKAVAEASKCSVNTVRKYSYLFKSV
jgi:D-aminopeptidase